MKQARMSSRRRAGAMVLAGALGAAVASPALYGSAAHVAPAAHVIARDTTAPDSLPVDGASAGRLRLDSLFTFVPFSAKRGASIGAYRIGFWPGEKGKVRSRAYANPEGFIEVTPENQNARVSEHFRLRDFLTHDQQNVWPKYVVLREELIEKLELVIDELNASGIPTRRVTVMSGFRTPQYNENGGDPSGRAELSRHQYGDAADIFVDNDGDGRMDDLNGDGRVDSRDAAVIQRAVDRVDAKHPELVGGVGLYRATSAHGPFAHVDVRGYKARWGRA